MRLRWRRVGPAMLICSALLLAGCERARQDMYDQPRGKPYAEAPLFADGSSMRTPPAGIVPYARGKRADSSGGVQGTEDLRAQQLADRASSMPYAWSEPMLLRGQQQYGVHCLPCHSPTGDGDGRIVGRGFPAPPSLHDERLRTADDRHLYEVIRRGYGAMHAYGDRIEPSDRWAIVAFVRALQLSQHAQVAALPAQTQAELAEALGKPPQKDAQ